MFDAALRRAGAVRVDTIGQMFAAAQLLGSGHRSAGRRLAIVSNAGGPAVMAADHAAQCGVELATLSPETITRLDAALPAHWSRANPVDVLGDAGPARYAAALGATLADAQVDGVLVMLTPQAMTEPDTCAKAVVEAASRKPVVACWMGGRHVRGARNTLHDGGIPQFNTPEASVEAFRFLWAHHHNQQLLLQSNEPLKYTLDPDLNGARALIDSALQRGQTLLSSTQSRAIVNAFGVKSTLAMRAATPDDALIAAEELGFPVVLKIDSPDITHKSTVGGVRTAIEGGAQVRKEVLSLLAEVKRRAPTARIDGVTVERMHRRAHGRELMIGVVRDPGLGPAISVGAGGTLVEVIRDPSVGLPPLTSLVVRDMIRNARVAPLLGAFRGLPPANLDALEEVLLRVSDLVCELPEVVELDINPLILDEQDAVAVDVRIVLDKARAGARRYDHMAIHPYPREYHVVQQLADGTELTIRPIRPEDAQDEAAFVRSLSERSKYFRFMNAQSELTPEMLTRFTQIDYDKEMAFVATVAQAERSQIGVSRYATNPDGTSCEFALVVADEWHGRGVGLRLMEALIRVARERGLHNMQGEVLAQNAAMLALVRKLGFSVSDTPDDPSIRQVFKRL